MSSPALARMLQEEPHHLHSLDIARGIAAFAVVFWHWQHFLMVGLAPRADFRVDAQPLFSVFRPFYLHGHEAVSLFFALSGFIFFWLFAQRIADGRVSLRDFFLQRFSRLYPLHFVTLVFVACGQALYHAWQSSYFVYAWNDVRHFVLNLLLLTTLGQDTGLSFNGPAWSISVEMLLYAVFFLFCAVLKPRPFVMALMACGAYLVLVPYKATIGAAIGAFFTGGCVSVVHRYLTRDAASRRVAFSIVIGTAIACVSLLSVPTDSRLGASRIIQPGDSPDPLTTVVFPMVILALALLESLYPTLFAEIATRTRLGPLSYSVYLIHFPLQLLVILATTRLRIDSRVYYSPLTLLAFMAALTALGLVSHYLFELPVQRKLRWWLRVSGRA